ncbi:DNA-binding protein [Saccharopolyspora rhizosphaerae]|uniref:DNA-binding protein n=1 Tax=Saccharopolyspora rhizosphaerae TaxID=2492662 RepID=A0A3R8P7H0_9PSEU|nr:DNA-binding protein [Saccharopolyspora rhizosphaerae]RRO17986.1 DNA-binding protein [Saccharopolyspora rhizosphaerae]
MAGLLPPLEITSGTPGGESLTTATSSVAQAWETFATGGDVTSDVRPDILASWYRCRDQYEVDPALDVAPPAPGHHDDQGPDSDVLFTQLGGLGALAGRDVELDGGVVAVTDGTGRILGTWGDPSARRRAEMSNMAPWSSWSEQCTGTNGMGTSFEVSGPVTVTGAEHWCEGFHQWACAGIAIRDVVTGSAIASINISRWGATLSGHVPVWLQKAATSVEQEIHRRALGEATQVVNAFTQERTDSSGPLVALDRGGQVVAANDAAMSLLRLPADAPASRGAVDPAERYRPDIPELAEVVRWAATRAAQDPQWSGYAQLGVSAEGAMPATLRPIVDANRVVGLLCAFGLQEGEPHGRAGEGSAVPMPPRVIGIRNDRLVLLAPSEIRYAEADRNTVWLSTDRGRILAATRGLDHVDRSLTRHGFRRVHRRFLVNLRRVAEVERGTKGELFLITDPRVPELVPVSRRHAPEVRRLLGV